MTPLAPHSTIGILGGGQLGRLLAMAAAKIGLHAHIYCPDKNAPAFEVARDRTIAPYDDDKALARFAKSCDVVTLEFENIPLKSHDIAAANSAIWPPRKSLEVAQDRILEKQFLNDLDLPLAPFESVHSLEDLESNRAAKLFPAILKTARLGYDGKGQVRISDPGQAADAYNEIGGRPAVLEQLIAFDYEISLLLVRGSDGSISFYDCPLNSHEGGILRESRLPSPLPPPLIEKAREMGRLIADKLQYVGVLAVEMFVLPKGEAPRLLINEIAPRVHNSGHWTLDACACDQFDNHIRAVAGWPLGATSRHADAVMTNLLGADIETWREIAAQPDTALHHYGKKGVAKGRKLGHATQISPRTKPI